MFDFTTTTVINSTQDLTTNKELMTILDNGTLLIRRLGTFIPKYVQSISIQPYRQPVNEVLTINLSEIGGLEEGDVCRLYMYVSLSQGSQSSYYSNDSYFKGKPFSVEFEVKGAGKDAENNDTTAEYETAKAIIDTIKRLQLNVFGEKMFNVENENGVLTITAVDEFQRFTKVTLEKFVRDDVDARYDEYQVIAKLESRDPNKQSGAITIKTFGNEGIGSYSYILRNLRLPTTARTSPFALNIDEAPIIGAQYAEYVITYAVPRASSLGMNAVGQKVMSETTHVLFVRKDCESVLNDWIDSLENIKVTSFSDLNDQYLSGAMVGSDQLA